MSRGARGGGLGGHTGGGRGRPMPAFTTPTLGIQIKISKVLLMFICLQIENRILRTMTGKKQP